MGTMKSVVDLYQRIPTQYRLPVLAGFAGIILLLGFMGMTFIWAIKAALSLGFKLIVVLVVCGVIFKVWYEMKKKKTAGL